MRDAGVALQPSVGDEDVQRAEICDETREHLFDVGFAGDVALIGPRLHAEATRFVGDVLGGVGADDIVDPDIGAGLGKRERDRRADAGIGAGDERLLPDQQFRQRRQRRRRVLRSGLVRGGVGHAALQASFVF